MWIRDKAYTAVARLTMSTLVVLSFVNCCSDQVRTIRIRTVDGRNGHPISNERLQVKINGQAHVLDLPADKNGIADIQIASANTFLEIESNLYFDCRPFDQGKSRPKYSVSEILKSGLVVMNTCGKLNIMPKPGEVVFFVRPLHWWEGLRR